MDNYVLNERVVRVPQERVAARPITVGRVPFKVVHTERVGFDLRITLIDWLAVVITRFAVSIDGKIAGRMIERDDVQLARCVDVLVKWRFVTEPRQHHLRIAGYTLLDPAKEGGGMNTRVACRLLHTRLEH